MARRQKLMLLVLAALAAGVLALLWAAPRPVPVPPPSPAPVPVPPPAPVLAPAVDAAPVLAAPPAPSPPPAAPRPAAVKRADAGTPQCVRDADCKGPRQADCTRATCTAGRCGYDYSRCECRTNEDCDDGDPCTRNHCFASTMKCVFIKDGCP